MNKNKTLLVGIPLYNGCTLMDFAGATQVFAAPFGFKPIWQAAEASITTTEGMTALPNYHFDHHPDIDILFVPGGGSTGVTASRQNPAPEYTKVFFFDISRKFNIKTMKDNFRLLIVNSAGKKATDITVKKVRIETRNF